MKYKILDIFDITAKSSDGRTYRVTICSYPETIEDAFNKHITMKGWNHCGYKITTIETPKTENMEIEYDNTIN